MKNIEKIIINCQICKKKLSKLFSLGKHPLCDDLVKINSKKINFLYPIDLKFCENCLIVFQKFQIRDNVLFPKNYHYRAKFTEDVINGQKSLVDSIIKKYGSLKNKKILDVGCNDGTLLNLFKAQKAQTFGIEPTDAFKETKKNHKVINNFFNYETGKKVNFFFKDIDYITFTNVFAHINNLDETIKTLKLLTSKKTKIIIENHYLGSVIEKNQIDTFYHEHPRTYSFKSLFNISKKLNLNIEHFEFPKRYGGNVRVFMGENSTKKNLNIVFKNERNFYKDLLKIQKKLNVWKLKKKMHINQLNNKHGPLPAKAFPGRAAILIQLLNLKKKHVFATFEKPNSKKIGHYIPGTKISILSDKNLRKNIVKEKPIINLAWHIEKEIKGYLKSKKIQNQIINIIDKKDFK